MVARDAGFTEWRLISQDTDVDGFLEKKFDLEQKVYVGRI